VKTYDQSGVKTTVFFEKQLLYEIDQVNPFSTRKEFLARACQHYLKEIRRKRIDHDLAQACAKAEKEDLSVNQEWEPMTLEDWR
jgi:hypothetical protein